MRSIGIRALVLSIALAPAAAIALALTAYFASTRIEDLDVALRDHGRLIARQLAAAADFPLFAGNVEALDQLVRGAAREDHVVAAAILSADDAEGKSVATAGYRIDRTLIAQTLEEGAIPAGDGFVLVSPIASAPLVSGDLFDAPAEASARSPRGWAVVVVTDRAVQAARRRLLFSSGGIALLGLAGMALLAFRLSRIVTRPLHELVTVVARVGRGDLEARSAADGPGDLRDLALGMNAMVQSVSEIQAELEARVERATRLLLEKEEAESASEAKTRFLAAASHDLRQPLHAVAMYVAELEGRRLDSSTREIVSRIGLAADTLRELFDRLLDVSRLDAGGLQPTVVGFELTPLLSGIAQEFVPSARAKGLRIGVAAQPVLAQSDPSLLGRIVANFVSNAVRYTSAGGVMIVARRRSGAIEIEVRDSGPGIASEDQAAIFDEFVQLQNPERDRSEGIGLGLAIVKRLATLLGHPIYLRSAPGRGSTFGVRVPIASQAGSRDDDRAARAVTLESLRVLVVDDDRLARESTAILLRGWGCRVVEHSTLAECLAAVRDAAFRPDLAILDFRLPDGTGFDALDALQGFVNDELQTVMVAGDPDTSVTEEARRRGVIVLRKPVQPARLRAVLQRLLARRLAGDGN